MATNWNAILSNANSLADILMILRKVLGSLEFKADLTTIDEAIDEINNIKSDVKDEIDYFQKIIKESIESGLYVPFAKQSDLLAYVPEAEPVVGKAFDTSKVWIWETRAPDTTPKWHDTGLSELDQAINRVQQQLPNAVSNSKNIITITDENGIPTWLAADNNGGVPATSLSAIQKAQAFASSKIPGLVFTDENGVLYDLQLNPDGTFSDQTKDALVGSTKFSQNDFYLDGDNVVKKLGAVRGKAAIFGSSTMGLMQPVIAAMLQQSFAFQDILQGGRSGERIEQIANRFGAIPVKLKFANDKINASSATNVSVNFDGLASMPTASSTLATLGTVRVNNQDVRGTFSYSAAESTFKFTRSTAGADIVALNEYEFIADGTNYSDAGLIILNAGKNNVGYGDEHGTAEYIADATLKMFKHIQPLAKKVIVISHYSNTTSTDALLKIVNDTNEYYRKQYGGLYFDMNAYLMSAQVWVDTAITPNADDLQKQSEGRLPLSLSRDTGAHLNDTANTAVVAKLKQFILEKGWF